ncbi:hypothetical protein [Rhizobium mongolense]|uniref:Uncharacterized protein n=1 Tax=Rhizobium mongolense TaxID=57676 RepID=A0A7W6RMN7_9HYPH|nr:hypothetical protein [Rhizobium mongolense]MBB4274668.1 hypothetical protein [Rhizobium mongolense]
MDQRVANIPIKSKPGDWENEKPEVPHIPAGPVRRYCTVNPDDSWADELVLTDKGTPEKKVCLLSGLCLDYLPLNGLDMKFFR